MLKKLSLALLLIGIVSVFKSSVAAQSDETMPIRKSALAETILPSGAQKIRAASVPAEIRETLGKLAAAGGAKIRQGDSEVIIWTGSQYKKSNRQQLTEKLETALRDSGWTYEIGERQTDFILFSLFRETPERRVLIGFFVPSDDAYIMALTEMLAANAANADSENSVKEPARDSSNNAKNFGGGSSDLIGKWWRGEGGGSVDYTGKTQYKSGKNFTFEFFADGTVEYTYELDVLSIVQCRTKELRKSRGRYSVSGDTLTINLNAGNTIGSSSCERKDNFNKATPAETITKQFQIRKMDSITRPDNPLMLCFDGQDGEACFEKSAK